MMSRAASGSGSTIPEGPETGYRWIREAAGVVARDDLSLFRMWGRDPVRMLNGLITNNLREADPGRAVYGAMLTPKGKIITDLRVVLPEDPQGDLWILLPTAATPAVAAHLGKYVPPLFARWEESDRRVIGVYGPAAAQVVAEVLWPSAVKSDEDEVGRADSAGGPALAIATRIAGGETGFDLVIDAERAEDAREALVDAARKHGGGAASPEAFRVARVEAGTPEFGVDFGEDHLPAEVFQAIGRMERAISFSKGCYTGQEVVVRIAHRGHVNRGLAGLLLGSSSPPPPRTAVLAIGTEKVVGRTGSAVFSPRLGQTVALAILRREVRPGEEVAIEGGGRATVAALPFSDGEG